MGNSGSGANRGTTPAFSAGTTDSTNLMYTEFLTQTATSANGVWTAQTAAQSYALGLMTFGTLAAAGGLVKGSMTMMGVGLGIWAAKKIEENPRLTRRDLIAPRRSLLVPQEHVDNNRSAARRGLFLPRRMT